MLNPFFLITLLAQHNIIIRINPAKTCISRVQMACNFLGNKINGPHGRYIICSPSPANVCNSKKIKLTVNSTAQKKL